MSKAANFNLDGLELHVLLFTRELISRHSLNLLCRKWRRHLLDDADELRGSTADFVKRDANLLLLSDGFAFGVVGVGGESETDFALVGLSGRGIKLSEASHSS